jgi:SAM-dependent methyltransferase
MTLRELTHLPAESALLQTTLNPWFTESLYTALKLNVPDLLIERAKTAEELAQETGSHARALYRVLRLLAGHGIFWEDENGAFSLTEYSQTLRSDAENSPREWILFNTELWRWTILNALPEVVSDGRSAYEHIYGKNIYEVFTERQEYSVGFNKGMQAWSATVHTTVPKAYDFSQIQTVVDLGGGTGNLVACILQQYPHLQGILFDMPHVAEQAKPHLEAMGVADRCEAVGGSFLEAVPTGADAYMFASVLMDWTDDHVVNILKLCHDAMQPGGRVLIVEPLVGGPNEPSFGKSLDIMIMLETYGGIRSYEQFQSLLEQAGFRLSNAIQTNALTMSILEAVRIIDTQ